MTDAVSRLSAALADRYRIERELGAGGMATVYLAEDLKHKRNVALKVLKPELAAVLGAERFVQEITTTAALQHPHILPLFDSGTADGFLYYVMPYIQGETLRARLDRETQLVIEEAVRIAADVAGALDYAHRNGVIHRDIKPENILLHDGRPMVADFGIALALSAAAGGRMTETGMSLGTPHYMSPEQATAEKEITARSDVYSLGSVLYEMLTGQPPHLGGSAQQIIMKIVTEEAQPVTQLRKSVPANVAAAVGKALEKLPADRFATAAAFADALANPSYARAGTVTTGPATIRLRGTVVNRALAVASAALVLALAWQVTRPAVAPGPRVYDVALPDSAPVDLRARANIVVAPSGEFAIYVRGRVPDTELWQRSLVDETVRRIEGTRGAFFPTISHDGSRLAFLRSGGPEVTVDVMPLSGGAATVVARSSLSNSLEWMADGRLLLTEGDGLRVRMLDPRGSASSDIRIRYCINPTLLPGGTTLLCGGGGDKLARWSSLEDSSLSGFFWTQGADSGYVHGADFRLVGDRYLVYVSNDGDLMAASVDLGARRVGRPVRMVAGLYRDPYSGAGSYALSASGTLVYANGHNGALGHLVSADGRTRDTLPVGREAFLQFALHPDGRRLATVVERTDGQELRVYDLHRGEHVVWLRRHAIGQPVWTPRGDRLITTSRDTLFVGPADAASPPAAMPNGVTFFESFGWLPDGRLVGTTWADDRVVATRLDAPALAFDTLATFAAIGRPSPDGRWLAYNASDFRSLWLEPLPRTGRRYSAGTGWYAQWVSPSEFVAIDGDTRFERIRVDASVQPPRITRQRWFDAVRLVPIAAGSFDLTPDGRVIYKEGRDIAPARFLRVVPNWVTQMKGAVDAANR